MNKVPRPSGYRVWFTGTTDQFSELDQALGSLRQELPQTLLVYVCPTTDAAQALIRLGQKLGLEGELLGHDPLTNYGYLPRHHADRYIQERKQIHDTWTARKGFTAQQIAHLTGIKHPNELIRSMLSLGQLCRHGQGRATYYTLGPNRP